MIMTHGIVQQAPTVEYKILQNFIDGHSIGEKVTAAYIPDWITTVISDSDCENNWITPWTESPAYQYLVNNTVGADLIDSRKPVDFTKYGVSSGTPFGNLTCNDDHYSGIVFNTNMEVTHPFTLEVWAACRAEALEWSYLYEDPVSILLYGKYNYYSTGNSSIRLTYRSIYNSGSTHDREIRLHLAYKTEGYEDDEVLATIRVSNSDDWIIAWHHYVIAMNSSTLFVFIDGELKFSKSLSDTVTVGNYTKTLGEYISEMGQTVMVNGAYNFNGYMFDANWAQLALCDTCKWTDDFTVPTEAY